MSNLKLMIFEVDMKIIIQCTQAYVVNIYVFYDVSAADDNIFLKFLINFNFLLLVLYMYDRLNYN